MRGTIIVEINRQTLYPYLLYSRPVPYNDKITLYPVTMRDVILFQECEPTLILRKDAIFNDKKILKMGYLEFIRYAYKNKSLAEKYDMPMLPYYYELLLSLLQLVCGPDCQIVYNKMTLEFNINDEPITETLFDHLRRIIILQNDVDFDPDEFMNIDTFNALERAREFEAKKAKEKADIEDYIDSVVVSLDMTEEEVSKLSIRKFWRYVNRIKRYDEYKACRSAELGGMVKFKEPLKDWMTTIEVEDKYEHLKSSTEEIKSQLTG